MKKMHAVAAMVAATVLTGPVLAQTTLIPGSGSSGSGTDLPGTTMMAPAPTMGTTLAPMPPAAAAGSAFDPTIGTLQGLDARDFFREAASGDVFEVESSRMALDKSSREEVRAFARQMIDEHALTTRQLADVGANHGFGLPMRPGITNIEKLDRLKTLSGPSFDRQYVMDQVMAHRDAVRLFQSVVASSNADMAPFQGFAVQTLPKLRLHLQHAEALAGMGMPTAQQ